MLTAAELLKEGRTEEMWDMCCGYLHMSINEFMDVQNRLMTEQLLQLGESELGRTVMKGNRPKTVEEFRQTVPLTDYSQYTEFLTGNDDDRLPGKPAQWVHSSGRTEEYTYKWVPMTREFCHELSKIEYGIGLMSCTDKWGETTGVPISPKIVYAVAPRPYVTGALADILALQADIRYMPSIATAENSTFEERIKLGFKEALDQGFDYFFGLSLVLVMVGEKFKESSSSISILPLLKQPRTAFRLIKGLIKSKLARRPLLPRDLWDVKGIMCGGLDSSVYRDKIKEMWGRYPLDIYAGTEGGIYATQTWNHEGMTFVPNLNFLEFIPEAEFIKWEMDRSYQPQTVLLDEVKTGESYEIVISNFHCGALVRYRTGDLVNISSLANAEDGISLPQMKFERRASDILDFTAVKLTESKIWQAVEAAGVPYEDWVAFKNPGEPVLQLLLEPKDGNHPSESEIGETLLAHIIRSDDDTAGTTNLTEDWRKSIDFNINVTFLPRGTFAAYTSQRQAEGADLAHLKPSHINPSQKILETLLADSVIQVVKRRAAVVPSSDQAQDKDRITA